MVVWSGSTARGRRVVGRVGGAGGRRKSVWSAAAGGEEGGTGSGKLSGVKVGWIVPARRRSSGAALARNGVRYERRVLSSSHGHDTAGGASRLEQFSRPVNLCRHPQAAPKEGNWRVEEGGYPGKGTRLGHWLARLTASRESASWELGCAGPRGKVSSITNRLGPSLIWVSPRNGTATRSLVADKGTASEKPTGRDSVGPFLRVHLKPRSICYHREHQHSPLPEALCPLTESPVPSPPIRHRPGSPGIVPHLAAASPGVVSRIFKRLLAPTGTRCLSPRKGRSLPISCRKRFLKHLHCDG